MSNKIKMLVMLFIVFSLSACAGSPWKNSSGAAPSDAVVAACTQKCGGGGTEGPGNAFNIPLFGVCRDNCLKEQGYTK